VAVAEVQVDQLVIRVPGQARVEIVPPLEMQVTPSVAFIKDLNRPRRIEFTVTLINRVPGPVEGALWVVPQAVADEKYEPTQVDFDREDQAATVHLALEVPVLKPPLMSDLVIEYRRDKSKTGGALASVKVPVEQTDFEVRPGLKVGYFRGGGSDLAVALMELGLRHEEIPASASQAGDERDLLAFDTIVIDHFSVTLHPELALWAGRLMQYARAGGNLVVFAQLPADWNGLAKQGRLADLDLLLSTSPVGAGPFKLLDAEDATLLKPNKIAWSEVERCFSGPLIYPPAQWSADFKSLVGPVNATQMASLSLMLSAHLGAGTLVYAGCDLRAALRKMDPNAYRMLANLMGPFNRPAVMQDQPR
jgi:hypothetical protein